MYILNGMAWHEKTYWKTNMTRWTQITKKKKCRRWKEARENTEDDEEKKKQYNNFLYKYKNIYMLILRYTNGYTQNTPSHTFSCSFWKNELANNKYTNTQKHIHTMSVQIYFSSI